MVAREDLHATAPQRLRALIDSTNDQAVQGSTVPPGEIGLGEAGDVTWTDAAGNEQSLKAVPDLITDQLAAGMATRDKRNTVSTNDPPNDITGYPDQAYWIKVKSPTDQTVVGLWQLTGGAWAAQSVPSTGLVASTINAGIIDVAVLAAQLIVSGAFKTANTGARTEMDSRGIRFYNADGNQTGNLDGTANALQGSLQAGSPVAGYNGAKIDALDGVVNGYGIQFTPNVKADGSPNTPPAIWIQKVTGNLPDGTPHPGIMYMRSPLGRVISIDNLYDRSDKQMWRGMWGDGTLGATGVNDGDVPIPDWQVNPALGTSNLGVTFVNRGIKLPVGVYQFEVALDYERDTTILWQLRKNCTNTVGTNPLSSIGGDVVEAYFMTGANKISTLVKHTNPNDVWYLLGCNKGGAYKALYRSTTSTYLKIVRLGLDSTT